MLKNWRDSRFQRELFIRGGITTIISAVSYFILGAGAWAWLFPLAVMLLVVAKWSVRPDDGPDDPAL